jgi:hypothetical protein
MGQHSLIPWWEYFLGVTLVKAYQAFDKRIGMTTDRDVVTRLPTSFDTPIWSARSQR